MINKNIVKIYKNAPDWYVQTADGVSTKIITNIDLSTYRLVNNFQCDAAYDGTIVATIDGSYLEEVAAEDLSNLTSNSKITITFKPTNQYISLTSNEKQTIDIKIKTSASQVVTFTIG